MRLSSDWCGFTGQLCFSFSCMIRRGLGMNVTLKLELTLDLKQRCLKVTNEKIRGQFGTLVTATFILRLIVSESRQSL